MRQQVNRRTTSDAGTATPGYPRTTAGVRLIFVLLVVTAVLWSTVYRDAQTAQLSDAEVNAAGGMVDTEQGIVLLPPWAEEPRTTAGRSELSRLPGKPIAAATTQFGPPAASSFTSTPAPVHVWPSAGAIDGSVVHVIGVADQGGGLVRVLAVARGSTVVACWPEAR